ncbi:Yolkless-like vitellogenin receptor protein, partial [Euroglyphus maynei]
SSQHCHKSFFDCGNGKCLATIFVCDGDNDCGNYRDELACNSLGNDTATAHVPHSPCPSNEFACNDAVGNCVPQRWVCDGQSECSNNADEANCKSSPIDCHGDFRCGSFECIPPKWRCDGMNDCMDHSDEHNCASIHDNSDIICDKLHDRYRCQSNGLCINYELVCDGKPDCPGGDDEKQSCHAEKCQDKKCSHLCFIDEHSKQAKCSCPPGYQLIDGYHCRDYDECLQQKQHNLCSHKCINLVGNYRCDCNDGYHLIDNRTCVANQISPVLYFSTGGDIHGYDTRDKVIFPVLTLNEYDPVTIIGLDMSIADGKLYYSIFHNDSLFSSVYEIPVDGTIQEYPVANEKRKLLFHDIKSQIEGISIDWSAKHIYMTEASRERIVVCSTVTLICATLIENLPSPRGITVVRSRYRLYWTQWHDRSGGIYESLLDGSEPTKLFSDVSWPNDIVYDSETNRLYWCDGKTGSIEYYDFDIEMRRIVHEDYIRQPYSMIVFEDTLYWTDWIAKKLFSCQKIECHEQTNIFQPTISKRRGLYGITMYHPLRQRTGRKSEMANPCFRHPNPCSHLCLSRTNTTFTCLCPDHMYLSNDSRTCSSRTDEFLIISTGYRLYKFYPDSSSTEPFEMIPMTPVFLVNDLAYNHERYEFYLYDRIRDRIVVAKMEPDFVYHTIVDEDLNGVFGLTFEVNSDNLYWVDMIKGTMEVVSIHKGYRAILNDKLDQPVSMAINALTKTVFVGLKSKNAQILMLTMDGQFIRSLLRSKQGFPFALTAYPFNNQLIWGDPVIERIDSLLLDNSRYNHHEPEKLVEKHVGTVQSMAILNSTLYWTNAESPRLYWTSLTSTMKMIESKKVPHSNLDNDVLKVISSLTRTSIYDYCRANNTCHHICLIGTNGQVCRCNVGFESQDNGHTCQRNRSRDETITKPVVHVINLEDIFDFILSKQKDHIFDSWIDAETNVTTTTPQATDDQQEDETKTSNTQPSSLPQSEQSNESANFFQRNSLYLWFIALCMVGVSILLCVKLNLLPVGRINSIANLVVHRHRETGENVDEESHKNVRTGQVRFFSNPNYQLNQYGHLKNGNNLDNDLLIS